MRELGAINPDAPKFPLASGALASLRAAGEAKGSGDFSPLWSGEAGALAKAEDAGEATLRFWREAQAALIEELEGIVKKGQPESA